jgi:hypothetical protein
MAIKLTAQQSGVFFGTPMALMLDLGRCPENRNVTSRQNPLKGTSEPLQALLTTLSGLSSLFLCPFLKTPLCHFYVLYRKIVNYWD